MAFACLQLLYMTLAIDKMDGCGLINAACHEFLPKEDWGDVVLATEGLYERQSTSFIKWVGECVVTHLKQD